MAFAGFVLLSGCSSDNAPPASEQPTTSLACQSGSVSVFASTKSSQQERCLVSGSSMTVTFDKSGGEMGTPGEWLGQPQVLGPSVLRLVSSSTDGQRLVTTFRAESAGTATVIASFAQGCSGPTTTPCTVPPQGILRLFVTVVHTG
jgi:hypothetical protein